LTDKEMKISVNNCCS